jgi:hypothetical protein
MINWTLEVEDDEDEDVACTVDDMEATDRLQSLVQRVWCEGREGRSVQAAQGYGDPHGACE